MSYKALYDILWPVESHMISRVIFRWAISEHTTQQNAEVKSIINKDPQVAPKRMPLGARLAVITHNMGGCFIESVKKAQLLMSPQEARDALESILEFQVQIKGHNQRENEEKLQGWQNWTDEKLATKQTKDDQQPVLLLPAKWWSDMLPEFESGGWWQRPHTRGRCRQCKCSLVENPSFESSKCQKVASVMHRRIGCGKQMKTRGKRPDGMVFTNADPRYAGKLDDPRRWHDNADAAGKRSHDGQSRDDIRIKLDLANIGADGVSVAVKICEWESMWSWKLETMQWPPYWSNRIFFGAYHHRFHSKHKKGLIDDALTLWWKNALKMLDLEWSKDDDQHQDAVQPVEHQSTSPRKCVQQEWPSTGNTADAVGSAFQTAGHWWPSASARTRSACRNGHKLVFRSRDTEKRVCQNPSRVATLGRTPW